MLFIFSIFAILICMQSISHADVHENSVETIAQFSSQHNNPSIADQEKENYDKLLIVLKEWSKILSLVFEIVMDQRKGIDNSEKNAAEIANMLLSQGAFSGVLERLSRALSNNAWNLTSPITGRTFGEAVEVMYSISLNKDVIQDSQLRSSNQFEMPH